MNREQAFTIVEKQISGPRYHHTVGVAETAVHLAERYGADVQKVELAAIFHDYAKLHPIAELKKIILKHGLDARLLQHHAELWHGPAGAELVKEIAGIEDESILDAIRFHTTGRANMSLIEKIVFLADYIEPGRQFPGVKEVRELAGIDLDAALIKAMANTIQYLAGKQVPIFPDMLEAYNFLLMNKGGTTI